MNWQCRKKTPALKQPRSSHISSLFLPTSTQEPNLSGTEIALAGATGNLGRPILKALLAAKYSVTVLSRAGAGNSSKLQPHPNLTIKEVDFTSVNSLAPALHGMQVVVSCLATSAIGSQNPLVDTSVQADVKRFIPAEFGMDT